VRVSFTINNASVAVEADPARPLLDILRAELGLTGTKQGCDHEGECGACTVLLDGEPVRSCLTPLGKVAGRRVETVEGLATSEGLHPLQSAFIETGAVQCGYCTPGMLMAAKGLLDRTLEPTFEQVVDALEGNLCRCTGYRKIADAVDLAARRLRGEEVWPGVERPALGGSELRSDSIPKVTGAAKYVEDMGLPGMLVGAVLRSPHHHARIVSFDSQKAREVPGVAAVLTVADIPGAVMFDDYSREEPVLPAIGETVRMAGAPVALVVAETKEAAEAALAAIEVGYELLPHTFDTDAALAPGATPIAGDGNVLTRFELKRGDLDAALDRSDVVVEGEYRLAYIEHSALERESLLGYYDEEGRLTVVGGCHEPYYQQGYIAECLGLARERVRVIVPPTGGSFGGKQDPWPFIATALMTHRTGGPVMLVYSRQESFAATPKRHPYVIRSKIGATRGGELTAMRVRIDANTGAYDSHGQYIPEYAVTAAGGPYRWAAVDAYAQTVYTNGPKAGQYRGFGTAQSCFATECAVDGLCEKLGADPLEFRLQNALRDGEPSFLGYPVAESFGLADVLESLRPAYEDMMRRGTETRRTGLARGVGLAAMWYRFGKSGSLRVEAHAELARDGHFVIYFTAADYGQGTNTTMSQMAAEALGITRDRIEVVNADTARAPDSGIQGASRATYFVGGAVTAAARNLSAETLGMAAELLDRAPGTLRFAGERVVAADGSGISLAEVAAEFDRVGKSRRVRGTFDLNAQFPAETRPTYAPLFVTGAHLAEVEVDLRTGETRVLRMVAAHDVGKAVNRRDAEGQIEGALMMGVGAALMEEVLPGHTTGFADYYLPTIKSMPEIEVFLVERVGRFGPFGVKGLGEAAMLPATPAIINAISRAIAPAGGRRLREVPATPERVLAALRVDASRGVAT
jgi:CO/xanthine dehydrogenase Mo-binding subunit/aerobic-type carbon monoxide dehydrogenase small subunit (CoxS/CutS family)